MSECPNVSLVLENWSHFNQTFTSPTSFLRTPTPSFLVRGVLKGKTGQLLTGCMRPSFDVALLCQACQEREMDSYRGRSGIRRGWQGGADSRLTAVINHLPCQPDAGWQEGARWPEWWFVHSLPEMSFCQPVSSGMLSVINPSDHLSINYFSRVKPVCDMLHFTVMLWRCGTASLIFSEPTGSIFLKKKICKCPTHITHQRKQIIIMTYQTLQ